MRVLFLNHEEILTYFHEVGIMLKLATTILEKSVTFIYFVILQENNGNPTEHMEIVREPTVLDGTP